jgi:hypothetical protein
MLYYFSDKPHARQMARQMFAPNGAREEVLIDSVIRRLAGKVLNIVDILAVASEEIERIYEGDLALWMEGDLWKRLGSPLMWLLTHAQPQPADLSDALSAAGGLSGDFHRLDKVPKDAGAARSVCGCVRSHHAVSAIL